MGQGWFISFLGVSYGQFSETVKHHDKLDEFKLGFVKHGTESQGSCHITFQAPPVSSSYCWPCDPLQWYDSINGKDQFLAGCCGPEEMPLADQSTLTLFPL